MPSHRARPAVILFFVGNAALAERVRAGERAAFAELYDEFADRIYGFCDALLRDRDEAADASHDTFVLAAQRIGQLRDLERLSPWLFAIARHVCFRRLEQRRRVTPLDLEPDALVLDEEPSDALSAADAAALVWAAADGLNERDRAVLVLNTREGLEGAELAAALGVQHSNPYSMLHRAKAQLERALGVLLVARTGRRDCAALSEMLDGWDGTLTPLLRKRLGRHVEACASCRATRSRANPLAVLAGAPLVRPSRADALDHTAPRDVSTDDLLNVASHRPETRERWQRDGFPPPIEARKRKGRRVLIAVAGLSAGLVILPLAPALESWARAGHPTTRDIRSERAVDSHRRTSRVTSTTLARHSSAARGPAVGAHAPAFATVGTQAAGAHRPSAVSAPTIETATTVQSHAPIVAPPTTSKPRVSVTTTTKAPGGPTSTTPTTLGET
jgi:RNA polymerase sigma factor (sigma-70 family)